MDLILEAIKESLESVYRIDREVRKKGLENEQWFLDWQDELNAISVK